MSHLFWLDQEHLKRIQHLFPKRRGVARVNDRKVLSGIIHVIRNGLRGRGSPPEYGPQKTLYNRFRRWSENGIFEPIFSALAHPGVENSGSLMIDATHLKTHRTASSLRKGAMRVSGMISALACGSWCGCSAPSRSIHQPRTPLPRGGFVLVPLNRP